MSKKKYLFIAIASLFLGGCSTSYESLHRSGLPEEISSGYEDYENVSDAGLMYLISNDSDSLYVSLKFQNRFTSMKVIRKGMTLWLDPSAKKNKAFGVGFPVSGSINRGKAPGYFENPQVVEGEDGFKRFQYPEKKQKKEIPELMLMKLQVRLLGFKDGNTQVLQADQSPYPVELYYDENNILTYQLAIPFEAIQINEFKDGKAISLGVITGSFEKSKDRPDVGRGQRNGGRQGGMFPGSMGGTAQRPRPDFNQMAMPVEFWIKKVYLSVKESE